MLTVNQQIRDVSEVLLPLREMSIATRAVTVQAQAHSAERLGNRVVCPTVSLLLTLKVRYQRAASGPDLVW